MSMESVPPLESMPPLYPPLPPHEIKPLADELEEHGAQEELAALERGAQEMATAQQKRQELYAATSLPHLRKMLEGVEAKIVTITSQPEEERNEDTLELMEMLQHELDRAIRAKMNQN